jgi:gliding motility-associated-like protein
MVEAEVSGNTGPLTFSWNNGLGNKLGSYVVAPTKATTYIITVTNACGSSISDSIQVLISELPVVKMASDTMYVCAPGDIHFSDKAGQLNVSDPIISWNWDFGDGNFSAEQHPIHSFTDAGLYSVNLNVISDRGCSNKSNLPINIRVYPKPLAEFSVNADSLDLPYDVLICTNQSTGAVNYNWTFGNDGNSTLQNPQILLQTLGNCRIELIGTSDYGCSDTIAKNVTTNADIVFPNAFTPREDVSSGGSYIVSSLDNDVFFPYTSGVTEYRLMIFNRWGEMIFESDDVKRGWDGYYKGKLCQGGVYVWKAKVKLNDGKVFNKAGNVTLLR